MRNATNNSEQKHYLTKPSDFKRYTDYERYEHIFLGNGEAAFNPKINHHDGDDNMYINELIGQLISFTTADYLFGEDIVIKAQDDAGAQFLEDFYDANKDINTLLYEAALTNSYLGDIVMEIKVVDGKPSVLFHDPRHWSFVVDDDNNITEHHLSFIVKRGDRTYLKRRIHEKGLITTKVFEIKSKVSTSLFRVKNDDIDLVEVSPSVLGIEKDEWPTGVDDEFLVRNVPNVRLLNRHTGLSDYQGKESLMNAYNMLTSYAHLILEKNADPALEVPKGTLDPEANVYREELKVFETDAETKGIPRYITWDGTLESLFEQRNHIMEMIALYSEISLSLLGKDANGAVPDNFRAMKLRLHRTVQKMNRKRRYWESGLTWLLQTTQRVLGSEASDYEYEWSDGLPDDEQTDLEVKQMQKSIGLVSNDTLIEEHGKKKGWTDERIEEEKARILGEKQTMNTNAQGSFNLFEREEVADAGDGTNN